MTEVWKDVVGYEEYYQVSNLGRYRSKDRQTFGRNKTKRTVKGKILKATAGANGYLSARFCVKGNRKMILLHRVVAMAFLSNPNSLPEVNHKDEDITNNCVDNLEWCTSAYNANYGTRNEKLAEIHRKPVNQLDMNGELIKRWRCAKDACDYLRIDRSGVMRVCKGRRKAYKGYRWEYAEPQVV